jgi:hypothetical protein
VRPRKKTVPKPVADLIERVYPSSAEGAVHKVFAWWSRTVPERVAENARPVRVHRGVLIVHTVSSAWSSELDFQRWQMLGAIRRHAPEANIHDIRFKVGPLPEIEPRRPARPAPPVVPVQALPEELARALSRVHDDRVRSAIANAAGVALGRAEAVRKRRP